MPIHAAFRPATVQQIALENPSGRLGIISTAISPQIGIGGSSGVVNDDVSTAGEHQFVYAVATDGTVRVVDVEGLPRECDTQSIRHLFGSRFRYGFVGHCRSR